MSRSSTGSWPQHQQVVASVCSHTSSSNSSSSQSSLILGIFPQKCCWKIFLAGLEPHFGSQKCWWRFFTKKWRQRRRAVCLLFFVCIVLSTYSGATSLMWRGLLGHRPSLAALTMGDYLFSARCWQLHLPKTVQKCNCLAAPLCWSNIRTPNLVPKPLKIVQKLKETPSWKWRRTYLPPTTLNHMDSQLKMP